MLRKIKLWKLRRKYQYHLRERNRCNMLKLKALEIGDPVEYFVRDRMSQWHAYKLIRTTSKIYALGETV